MDNISNRFSLTDFLAYLFPGIFSLIGICVMLLLTPLKSILITLQIDLNITILFLVFSFILGVLMSGIAEILTFQIRHKNDTKIPVEGFEKEIEKAFNAIFVRKKESKWTRQNFYLCRSMVMHYMPNESQVIQRQSSFRQFRMNLLPALVIWILNGVLWGLQIYFNFSIQWGFYLILATAIFGITIFLITINRMQNNDTREIRETLVAFLIGYKTGLFKSIK